jgi:hypothetical protein
MSEKPSKFGKLSENLRKLKQRGISKTIILLAVKSAGYESTLIPSGGRAKAPHELLEIE